MEGFNWLTSLVIPYFNFFPFLGMAVLFFRKPFSAYAKSRRESFLKEKSASMARYKSIEQSFLQLEDRLKVIEEEMHQSIEAARIQAQLAVETSRQSTDLVCRNLMEDLKKTMLAESRTQIAEFREELVKNLLNQVDESLKANLSSQQRASFLEQQLNKLGN